VPNTHKTQTVLRTLKKANVRCQTVELDAIKTPDRTFYSNIFVVSHREATLTNAPKNDFVSN
jgi:hypothetical protein